MNTNNDLWLCLHFPLLPVEVFSRSPNDDPTIKPIVVLSRQRVAYLNKAAQDIGIKADTSMNTAYTISEDIVCFERNEEKEFATLAQLAQWAYQFTPNVTIKAPHSLLLDINGCLKLFRGLDNFKTVIASKLASLGFSATMGINRTPLAALCSAAVGLADNTGEVSISLANIPVQHLHIEQAAKDSLHQMGVGSTKQLLALPFDGLNRRFGVFFTDYLRRLIGEKPDPQKFISHKPSFTSDITFLSDVTNIESLAFPIKRLLTELQDFLRGRQLLINQFTFTLSHRSHPAKRLTVFLNEPDNDAQMFLTLCQLQLEKVNDVPEVDHIGLAAKTFFEAQANSGDLFQGTAFKHQGTHADSKAEQVHATRLLNMMTARLGQTACFGLSLANDHRPELAWKPVRIAERNHQPPVSVEPNPRPMYLLPKPKALSSKQGMPYMSGQLTLVQGPERIDFGWWDKESVSRDYYISRHRTGALYWVFRHLDNNDWYLHGIFS